MRWRSELDGGWERVGVMSDIDCKERRECGRGDSTVFIRETVEESM